ncbi:hypothetical protein D9756_006297 [Leucocoprinus leucothites]|uniref:Uncharacterized protein n=1 Tax=Leucocoprinus leucothites TaxID=201217 RepID=A0A8H5D498_9AGAR|nr:hypothetical protein D9756_006297 [Leucoagaricus leucothites]
MWLRQRKRWASYDDIISAATATVAALKKHGMTCAAVGSLACKLYGDFGRDPKDVDMLVLQSPGTPVRTAEEIKRLIVATDPSHFFLKYPRDILKPYRILCHRKTIFDPYCKVDILTPGIMNLPNIPHPSPRKHITTISGIPLVPFSLLLALKLQAWSDHLVAREEYQRIKHVQDATDVGQLLDMKEKVAELRRARPWHDSELFSEELQELTRMRVKNYCKQYPHRAVAWRSLGFEIYVSSFGSYYSD